MATSKPRLDRRIVRSRNAILLLSSAAHGKPLADITVSAIAREANVDRKTFFFTFTLVRLTACSMPLPSMLWR
mgnify:CR=1 FL=1